MSSWNGCNCSICNKPLQDEDDIVVCPYCGTPYHRECYEHTGVCVFADKHAEGYTFEKPRNSLAKTTCPNCQEENAKTALFCEKCGTPLAHKEPWNNAHAQQESQCDASVQSGVKYGNGQSPTRPSDAQGGFSGQSPYFQAMPAQIEGVSCTEWQEYLGKSAPYYLLQFHRMELTKSKTSFCWSAFLFTPLYFLYRKMWTWAALTGIVLLAVSIPSFLQMLVLIDVPLSFDVNMQTLGTASFICSMINWAISALSGFFAFYLYREHSLKKIKALRENQLDIPEYHAKLIKAGGTSLLAIVIVFVVFFCFSSALGYWIGPEKLAAYYYM